MSRLTILKEVGVNKHRKKLVLCKCDCGKEKIAILSEVKAGRVKSCGCFHNEIATNIIRGVGKRGTRENNANWKGGKRINHQGYVCIYQPEHPKAQNGYVLEHRLVMEKRLGRLLLPTEIVHHKNGNRTDNADDNLEVWNTHHPKGQKAEDLVEYAKEILALYGGA